MSSPFITKILEDGTLMIGDGTGTYKNGLKEGYKNIETVEIPEEIDNKRVTIIGPGSFCTCTRIKNLTLPSSIVEIMTRAFDMCSINIELLDLSLLPNLKKLYRYAFATNRFERIKIGASLSYCEEGVFANIGTLEEIIVDQNNKYFSNDYQGSFYNKKQSLLIHVPMNKYFITIHNGVKTIGFMAFYGSKIKTLIIPNSVSDLHNSAFYGMPNIEEMIFQCNLRKISNVAVSVGTLKRLVYMRKEEVKSNILGSTNVSKIITCSQYSSATFSGKEITDKIGICFTPKIITNKCKQNNARTHLFIYVSLIYS